LPKSAQYRSFEDDLVDDATFDKRHLLLPQLGLTNTNLPIREQLRELRVKLDESYERVNQRIQDGDNTFIRMRNGQLLWDHARHSRESLQHEPFFDTLERVDIDNLLLTVDSNTDFMSTSSHCEGKAASSDHFTQAEVKVPLEQLENYPIGVSSVFCLEIQETPLCVIPCLMMPVFGLCSSTSIGR
jgi:hypothetical protein